MNRTENSRRVWLKRALCLAVAVAFGCGGGDDAPAEGGLVVMTQNLYYGFDTDPILSAQDPNDIPVLTAQAYQQLLSTNFPERAEAIADEIAAKRPHLVGLQEVALIRTQSPGDAIAGGSVPADTVLFDYLGILRAALAARGLDYRVAGMIQNLDVELPMLTGTSPLTFDDIRLTDFDVVLARGDVETSNALAANYQSKLYLSNLGIEVPRGYVALDATVGGRVYRFATTHLEDTPFPAVQLAQAQELAAALASETKPVVLVGDFNSPAPGGGACPFLSSQGFVDTWPLNDRIDQGSGLTWGHDPDLRNASDQFTVRIDLVFVREPGGLTDPRNVIVSAEVWGDDLSERTATGMWPSDHAAVVANLLLAKRSGR